MTLEEADTLIKSCIDKMNAIYRQPVFDEWAIVKQNEKQGLVLAYSGPRVENVQRGFLGDLKHIISDMESDKNDPGLFAFSRDADGTNFDAFIVLGEGIFLICNNTTKTMEDITGNPLWLQAQVPFVNLSNKFLLNQVVPPASEGA